MNFIKKHWKKLLIGSGIIIALIFVWIFSKDFFLYIASFFTGAFGVYATQKENKNKKENEKFENKIKESDKKIDDIEKEKKQTIDRKEKTNEKIYNFSYDDTFNQLTDLHSRTKKD